MVCGIIFGGGGPLAHVAYAIRGPLSPTGPSGTLSRVQYDYSHLSIVS